MDSKKIFKILVLTGFVALLVFVYQSGLLGELSFENLKARQGELQEWTAQNYSQAVALYFLIYVATTAASLPGAAVLTLAGGAIFGLGAGTLIVSFASTLGATLCFLGSRLLFRDWVVQNFHAVYEKVQKGLDKEGVFYLFTLRLIPAVPFFVINLVFGLTRMKPLSFFFVSQVGMLPGTLAYVNAGTQLSHIESPSGILSLPVIMSFVILGLVPWVAKAGVGFFQQRKVYKGISKPSRFDYDVLVVGAGAAGLVSAYIAAALKSKVGLIEKHRMGG
ncbi:MAG: VTT domain-containing protein, partial [Bdellovibrionales bacterium]